VGCWAGVVTAAAGLLATAAGLVAAGELLVATGTGLWWLTGVLGGLLVADAMMPSTIRVASTPTRVRPRRRPDQSRQGTRPGGRGGRCW